MKIFNTLALEISSSCNRRCVFCPVSQYQRPDERMPKGWIRAACHQLLEIDYRGRVEFYLYNEPFKDREWLWWATEYFHQHAPKITLMIATNGDFVKGANDLNALFDAGMNQILLNAYSPQQYPRFLEWEPDVVYDRGKYTTYKALPRNARCLEILDKSDPDKFGSGVFALQNRAGSIPDFLAPTIAPAQRMCVKPFRVFNINWKGQALVCCNDYYGHQEVGKFPEQRLLDIWNSPILNAYRERLHAKDRSLPLCRVCDCHAGAYPHLVSIEDLEGPSASAEECESNYTGAQ